MNQPSKLRTTNWVKINDESKGKYGNSNIRFKTSMIRLENLKKLKCHIFLKNIKSFYCLQ